MSEQETQLHIVKTIIMLKKVNISVKFPCSISFALKNQQRIIEHKNIYQLKKGQCLINQTIETEVEVLWRRGAYEDKKIGLQISMISVNGKIPAGSVTINPTDKIISDKIAPLEKCPDKNAEVVFTQNFQFVDVSKKISQPHKLSISLIPPGGNELSRSRLQYSASSSHIKSEVSQETPRVEFRPEGKLFASKHQKSNKDLRASGAQTASRGRGRLANLKIEDMGKNCVSGNIERSSSRASRTSSQYFDSSGEQTIRKSRMSILEQTKSNYIKKINKFRHSVPRVDSQQHIEFDDEIDRIKLDDHEYLDDDDISLLQERSRKDDRMERQSLNQMRDMRDQLDKRRSRIIQLDNSRINAESHLGQKDKIIAMLQQDKKKLQEQLDQERAATSSAQKRLQMKQNSYKQQLKKINEKYAQSESQRQKAVIQYNNLLASIEASQLKNQYALRQKQRNLNEQKMKLNKKIDQLVGELTSAYEKISEWKILISELEEFQRKSLDKQHENESKIMTLMEQNKSLLYELRVAEQNMKRLNEQKQKAQNNMSEDKINYKRKYNEILNQISQYRQKYERAVKNQIHSEARMSQLQAKLDKESRDKKELVKKVEELRKKQHRRQYDDDKMERISQTYSMQAQSQSQRVGDLKQKLDNERQKVLELQRKYEANMNFINNQKQMLENEVDELKWRLQKEIQKFHTLNARNSELSEQMLELSQRVIIFQEKELTNSEKIRTKNSEIQELSTQVSNLDEKMNYIKFHMKDKDEGFYELQKMAEGYCRDLQIMKDNNKININTIAEKNQQLRKVEQKYRSELKDQQNIVLDLKSELDINKDLVKKLKQEIDLKNKEVQSTKDSYKNMSSNYSSLVSRSDSLKQQDKEKDDKIQALENQLELKKLEGIHLEKQLERKVAEFDDYKTRNTNALEQFFSILNRQQSDLKKQQALLLTLPDEKLSEKLREVTNNHNNLIHKLQDEVNILTSSVKYFETEIVKQEQYIQQLQQTHGQELKKEQQKNRILNVEQFQQRCSLNEKIQSLNNQINQKTNQIDSLKNQMKQQELNTQNINESLNKKDKKISQLKNTITKLDKQIFTFKQKQIKDKLLSHSETGQVKEMFVVEQERSKMMVENHKEELKHKDKVIGQKVEQIKKYVIREEEFKLEKDKLIQEIKDASTREEQLNRSVQALNQQLRQQEKLIRQAQNEFSSLKFSRDQVKLRQIGLEEEIKRHKADNEQLTEHFRRIREDQDTKIQQALQLQRKEREKREKMEGVKEKLEQDIREVRQKCIKLQSQIQFHTFYKMETSKKLDEYEKYKAETIIELIKWRQNSFKNQNEVSQHSNKYIKYEVEIQSLNKQKTALFEQNNRLKQKITDLYETISTQESTLSHFDAKQKQIVRLNNIIQSYDEKTDKNTAELRSNLAKTKQALSEKQIKVKELQKFVEERYNDQGLEKLRWEQQFSNQKNQMQIKMAQIQDKYQIFQDEYQFQKLQAIREVQSANGIIQELNEVIRQKEDYLSHKDDIINEQAVRIEQLSIQLNECVSKWQVEKESYFPTESKMAQINEELARMNKFINDLDGRNKQLLEINKRRMQQKVGENQTSLTMLLKQIYGLMLKNKNKILNRCQTEKEKEAVIKEFKNVQQKLDMTLKSTQIVTARN